MYQGLSTGSNKIYCVSDGKILIVVVVLIAFHVFFGDKKCRGSSVTVSTCIQSSPLKVDSFDIAIEIIIMPGIFTNGYFLTLSRSRQRRVSKNSPVLSGIASSLSPARSSKPRRTYSRTREETASCATCVGSRTFVDRSGSGQNAKRSTKSLSTLIANKPAQDDDGAWGLFIDISSF